MIFSKEELERLSYLMYVLNDDSQLDINLIVKIKHELETRE